MQIKKKFNYYLNFLIKIVIIFYLIRYYKNAIGN